MQMVAAVRFSFGYEIIYSLCTNVGRNELMYLKAAENMTKRQVSCVVVTQTLKLKGEPPKLSHSFACVNSNQLSSFMTGMWSAR